MSKFKILFFAAVLIFSSISNFSYSEISSNIFFSAGEIKFVLNGDFLTSVIINGIGEVHSPGMEKTTPVLNRYFTIPSNYDMAAVEKGFFFMEGNSANRLRIYRTLTDFPALKGMLYYSQTMKNYSALIIDSYRIQSREDSVSGIIKEGEIPEKKIFHFAVRDNRLGLITFRSEFIRSGDNFVVINTSTGNSTKFGMKIFNPGDYRIHRIFIYDRNLKGYFFYTVQFMKVRSDILNKTGLIKPESFGNRIRAENVHFLKMIGVDRSGKLAAFK